MFYFTSWFSVIAVIPVCVLETHPHLWPPRRKPAPSSRIPGGQVGATLTNWSNTFFPSAVDGEGKEGGIHFWKEALINTKILPVCTKQRQAPALYRDVTDAAGKLSNCGKSLICPINLMTCWWIKKVVSQCRVDWTRRCPQTSLYHPTIMQNPQLWLLTSVCFSSLL